MRKSSIIFALILGFSACAHQRLKMGATKEGEVVEAEGLAPYKGDDLPGTKAAALAAAQRSAVERVVGVYISGQTRVDKAVAIDQNILAKTAGYIQKYDILDERKDGDYWKTKIRALVSFSQVEQDLKSFGILEAKSVGSPRVAVLVDETLDGQPADTTYATDGLSAALVDSGYTVVDRSALAGAAMQQIIAAVDKGDTKAAVDLGSQVKAEVIILGQASAAKLQGLDARLGGFTSYRAQVSAKAVRSGTGQLLASASRQASGMDVDAKTAASKSLDSAARLAAENILSGMTDVLKTRSEVLLKVSGVGDLEKLKTLEDALRGLSSIDGVYLRSYANGEAEISLGGGLQGQDIANKFSALKSPGLQVKSITPSEISAELR